MCEVRRQDAARDPFGDRGGNPVAAHLVTVRVGDLSAIRSPTGVVVGPAHEPFAFPRRQATHPVNEDRRP